MQIPQKLLYFIHTFNYDSHKHVATDSWHFFPPFPTEQRIKYWCRQKEFVDRQLHGTSFCSFFSRWLFRCCCWLFCRCCWLLCCFPPTFRLPSPLRLPAFALCRCLPLSSRLFCFFSLCGRLLCPLCRRLSCRCLLFGSLCKTMAGEKGLTVRCEF